MKNNDMNLRTSGDRSQVERLFSLRRLIPCAAFAVLLLAFFAGSSGAGVAQYTGTLYLDGGTSSIGSGNYQISTAAGPAQGAAPTVAGGVSGTGGPTGSFVYVYVVNSGGASTASPTSATVTVTNAPITVSGFPAGADLYRQKTSAGAPQGQMILVASGVSAPYVDSNSASTGTPLPQSENRPPTGAIGWLDFTPGANLGFSNSSTTTPSSTPPAPTSCSGWIVEGLGGVTVPAGSWTVQARVRSGAMTNGVAYLSAAVYIADASGSIVGTVFGPADGTQQIQNVPNPGIVASVSATTSSATTIASTQHLCVMFWRHQTGAYTLASANRYVTLVAYDPANAITIHPAPNGFAWAAPSSPADGYRTQTIPALSATYSDAENDAGTLTIHLCSDSGCATELQNSGAMAATNGSTPTWTPTGPLADNTYWWQAQAKDGPGLASAWTSTRSFTIDTTPPATTITSSPAALSNSASGSFAFNAAEAVTGYQCKLDAGAFAACTSPYAYSGLSDGGHTFSVKATADLAGNPGSTTSYGWTIDTAPPNTSITASPSALSNSSSPSFSLSATEVGSTFECNLDGAGFAPCPNPQTYSSVADGPHTFQARAVDPAGNVDPTPSSYSWTIDATPPNTSIGPTKPAALTTATSATFDFSATEPGSTFECSRDGGAFSSCTSPKTYSALADGSHTFAVRATDAAGNTDPSPDSYTWVVDTTPPNTTIGPTMPPANSASTTATFDVASTEPGSTFQCRLDGGAYGSCTTPVTYTGLADGTHTFSVKATDPAGNADASAAAYSWDVDTVAPATPPLTAPDDGLLTNATPELRASFADGTPGDSGTVEFQICATSAPAGTACAPLVSSTTSASVSDGGTAAVTPPPLPDGTYHWQARARDLAGNQSGWSATRSFQIDSSIPIVPALVDPADGAWVATAALQATFSKPAFAGTGTVEFRICSDALCLATVSTGSSGALINGATASWTPTARLADGMYYWQARAHDAAGNQSAWSAARMFHLDATPPAAPTNFNGQVAGDGLTLRWDPPDDNLDNFYVYVDGVSGPSVGPTTYEYKVGAFDANDARAFGVVAVDRAGNRSPMSKILVGVPNVVGLTLAQAEGAARARGLVVRREIGSQQSGGADLIATQNPAAGSIVARGTTVKVALSGSSARTALTVSASPSRVTCRPGSVLRLRLSLSEAATVRARLLSWKRTVASARLGSLPAGASNVRVKLPRKLTRGTYKLVIAATAGGYTARTVVTVAAGSRRACSSR